MMRHLLSILVATALGSTAAAQPANAPAAAPATEAPAAKTATGPAKTVRQLTPPLGCATLAVADGLPHSHVLAIVQDKLGFIWFGTQEGLARYDGVKLRVYRKSEDPTSLSSNFITALAVDAEGNVWAGTELGVNVYNPKTDKFTRYLKDPGKGGLSSDGVTAVVRDYKDRMWFAMSDGGLNRFDPATKKFIELTTKPLDVAITSMAADAAGNLWLGTLDAGVIRWNPDTDENVTFGPDLLDIDIAPVKAILYGSDRKVWAATEGEGLRMLDPETKKVVQYNSIEDDPSTISDNQIKVLFEDKNKHLWIGTSEGLNKMDAEHRVTRYLSDPNDPKSLSFNGVESLFQDAGGVMWAGGFTVGVCRFSELLQAFGHYPIRNLTTAFLAEDDGTMWVGTYNAGLYKYERAAGRVTIYHELRNRKDGQPGSIPLESQTWITSLHKDKSGTLWISFDGRGLVAFDPKTETYREYLPDPERTDSLPVARIFDIWEDDAGILWLASWGSGLVRFDPKAETFAAYGTQAGGNMSANLYTLHPDTRDKQILWIGTSGGGLVRFNLATSAATSYRHQPDDPTTIGHDAVPSVYVEPNGTVWAGTYGGGLSRLDATSGKFERYTTLNTKGGLTNDGVLGVLPGDDGRLWMSTNGGGLVSFDPKTKTWDAYYAADGLQDNEFNQGAFYRAPNGELFFGGSRGFNAFFPKNIKRDTYAPPVVLTAVKVFNQELKLPQPIWTNPKLRVSYTDSFEIQFAALAYAAPDRNRYAYKLEGFDDRFIETERPFAQYAKLPGGKYTLRVRASNRHGQWTETPIALTIGVTPPWWRSWQAFIGYLLVLAGAVYILFRVQRERVRRAEREGRLAVVERDLELTGAVQTGFLPDNNEIATERLQLFGYYRPADACSGDWWWHEPLRDGRHMILVGDVTGHGPGPAMVTAAVATAFRVLAENGLDNVEQGLQMLNREVLRVAKGKYHMTMAALELDETTGRWVLFNAGAPPVLSLNAQGKHRVHFCPGAPLGTENGFEVGRVEGQLKPTERLLLYTDGIPEIILPNGNVLGMRRFAQLYEKTRPQPLREVAATILAHADQTRGTQPQLDDWTFTLVEWG